MWSQEIFSDGFESGDFSAWNDFVSAVSVNLDSPQSDFVTSGDTVEVSGTVTGKEVALEINGVPVTVNGHDFSTTVLLTEGINRITAVATSAAGEVASASLSGRRDTSPPTVVFESPPPNTQVTLSLITVAGVINDIIPGVTVNGDDVSLTIDGVPVPISNRSFMLTDVPLALGVNAITAVATDVAGNTSTATLEILREADTTGIHFEIVGGNNQTGALETTLPEPLTVRVLGPDGVPLSDFDVDFTVINGDGVLEDPSDRLRRITQTTDMNGEASVTFQLGRRSGEGFHRVRAGAPASFTFIDFCQSALAGPAARMNITHDPPVRGVAGQDLSNPLAVVVTDEGGNPVSGVPVTFAVETGGGYFGGQTSRVVNSDLDGIASAVWTLGRAEDAFLNTALVSSAASPAPIRFEAFGYQQTAAPSTISGQVFDSVGGPIEGVKALIRGTALETFTDASGQFVISGVAPGFRKLVLLGSAANEPMDNLYYADIVFDVEVLSGVDNPLDAAVTLPFLDNDNAQLVGGSQDVTLQMEGMPGFEITVFANSVILPDGTRGEISMSSSQVKSDKLPMLPIFGTAPRAVGTLQPGGIGFDPPALVSYPNTSGLGPGDEADTFFFHSDLGQFVNAGPATVSEDGDRVVSDPGFGLTQSGWHCLVTTPGVPATCKNTGNGCAVNFNWTQIGSPPASGMQFPSSICPGKPIVMTAIFRSCGGSNPMFTGAWDTDAQPPPAPVNVMGINTTTNPALGVGISSARLDVNGNAMGTASVTSPLFGFNGNATCDLTFDVTVKPAGASCQAQFADQPPAFEGSSTRVDLNGVLDIRGCEVRVGNRWVESDPFGKFILEGVQTLLRAGREPIVERYRAQVMCPNGETGQSEFVEISSGSVVEVGPIMATALDPIPTRISVTAPSAEILTSADLQLTVTGHYADGSTRDLTAASEGTTYVASTVWVAATENGLLSHSYSGLRDFGVSVMALNQGNSALIDLTVRVLDSDSDGMPDVYENGYAGLDANTADANGDVDSDGLSNLEEYLGRTDPERDDTDGDGLLDGADREPLRPQLRKTEGAVLSDVDGLTGDRFGTSVAIDGDVLVTGAPGDDDLVNNGGAVIGFQWDPLDELWLQAFELQAFDAAENDRLGLAVALSSNRLLASAVNSTTEAGAVYVFESPVSAIPGEGSSWAGVTKLVPADIEDGDRFGSSLAMADDWAIIGAPGDDDLGPDAGAAYIYHRDAQGTWILHTKLVAADGEAGDAFGSSVAITSTGIAPTAVIGAPLEDALGVDAGAVYFFERETSNDTWNQGFKQFGSDSAAGDNFGNAVAIDGRWAVVGAHFNSHPGTAFSGGAYTFIGYFAGQWFSHVKLIGQDTGDLDLFGSAVALETLNNYPEVILGSPFDVHDGSFSGSAYRFRGYWTEANKLVPSGMLNGAELGSSLAVSNRMIVVGAPSESLEEGRVYVYE